MRRMLLIWLSVMGAGAGNCVTTACRFIRTKTPQSVRLGCCGDWKVALFTPSLVNTTEAHLSRVDVPFVYIINICAMPVRVLTRNQLQKLFNDLHTSSIKIIHYKLFRVSTHRSEISQIPKPIGTIK